MKKLCINRKAWAGVIARKRHKMTQVLQLTDELFVLAGETVVAGLLVKGDSAFLNDCHAGCTQELLWSLGVSKLAGILLTQHRRDQTEGISNWHGWYAAEVFVSFSAEPQHWQAVGCMICGHCKKGLASFKIIMEFWARCLSCTRPCNDLSRCNRICLSPHTEHSRNRLKVVWPVSGIV